VNINESVVFIGVIIEVYIYSIQKVTKSSLEDWTRDHDQRIERDLDHCFLSKKYFDELFIEGYKLLLH